VGVSALAVCLPGDNTAMHAATAIVANAAAKNTASRALLFVLLVPMFFLSFFCFIYKSYRGAFA
jgi:hypothetical protein